MDIKFKYPERRRCRRFSVMGSPLAVMRPAPSMPGKLLRISREAAEILYCNVNGSSEKTTDELDVLVADFTRGLYLGRLPVTTVADGPASPPAEGQGPEPVRRRVVRFEKLTPDQRGQIESFIHSFAG